MKHLLPQTNYYRANLHCHSTISDGAYSPEELKEIYKSRGYQILAITDHNITIAHPELEDENFLLLTANEINIDEKTPIGPYGKTYHLNLYAKRQDNLWQPWLPPKLYNTDAQKYVDMASPAGMVPCYDVNSVNAVIAAANENGFLVCYNHPTWSMQSYPDYAGLKGLWGMVLYNTCTCLGGCDENNNRIYQDLLMAGNPLFAVAADDLHHRDEHKIAGGWVMIGADKLEYASIIEAMEKGNLYASTGATIHALTIDKGIVSVDCSPAHCIKITSHCRRGGGHFLPAEGQDTLTHCELDLNNWLDIWKKDGQDNAFIRVEVTAPNGAKAYTRAYRLAELL